MEYQKLINLLDNTPNEPTKFRTKNWIETMTIHMKRITPIVKLNLTSMLKSSLCDYSDEYILESGTMIITGEGDNDAAKQLDERNEGVIFKNCAPFTDCISETNNNQMDNAKDIDVVMLMYKLIEYSDKYSKTSGSLWQYYRDDPNDNITQSESFKSKIKITGKTPADGNTKNVEIAVPLKYLSNFWRTLETPLMKCEINLTLAWYSDCVISSATGKKYQYKRQTHI